jgi:hypothetical protein
VLVSYSSTRYSTCTKAVRHPLLRQLTGKLLQISQSARVCGPTVGTLSPDPEKIRYRQSRKNTASIGDTATSISDLEARPNKPAPGSPSTQSHPEWPSTPLDRHLPARQGHSDNVDAHHPHPQPPPSSGLSPPPQPALQNPQPSRMLPSQSSRGRDGPTLRRD